MIPQSRFETLTVAHVEGHPVDLHLVFGRRHGAEWVYVLLEGVTIVDIDLVWLDVTVELPPGQFPARTVVNHRDLLAVAASTSEGVEAEGER